MRGTARRARRFNGTRRQRSPLVSTQPGSANDDAAQDGATYETDDSGDELERIEVHVHVHRGDFESTKGSRRKRPLPPPVLTGALFDWKEHYEQFCKLPAPPRPKSSSLRLECEGCGARVGLFARTCVSCQAPLPRHALGKVIAALGLGAVIGVFLLCAHVLGDSVAEHKPPAPSGAWSDVDVPDVIEVPVAVSPFTYDPYAANHVTISTDRTPAR